MPLQFCSTQFRKCEFVSFKGGNHILSNVFLPDKCGIPLLQLTYYSGKTNYVTGIDCLNVSGAEGTTVSWFINYIIGIKLSDFGLMCYGNWAIEACKYLWVVALGEPSQ